MLALFSVLAISVLAEDASEFTKRETAYFAIELPRKWKLVPVEPDDKASKLREFNVSDAESGNVFMVSVAIDSPRFIDCFCAPWRDYKRYEKDGLKYADLTQSLGSVDVRTLKIIGPKYGTDVHLRYGKHNRAMLGRIIESIRPK
jgi:hypothetical protein